jgi:hypothetical protein
MRVGGTYTGGLVCQTANVTDNCIQRYDNLNQLSMWGVVYQESNGAGFSLEFIGDMHDSSAAGVQAYAGGGSTAHTHRLKGIAAAGTSAGAGRGIN